MPRGDGRSGGDDRGQDMPEQQPVRWDERTWEEIAAIRAGGIDMVILPIGATEQHGRHLPCGVDTLSAVVVAEGVSARTGIPVLPALPYGCSLGHSRKWPGTLSLRPETLSRLVLELAAWVESAGFTRMLMLNGHVTNFAPLRSALEAIRADLPAMRIALRSVWEITEEIRAAYEWDGGGNWHANEAETSLLLHLRPDLVRMDKARDEPNRATACFFSYTVDKESETGVVGCPTRGSAAAGERLLEVCVAGLAAQLVPALTEATPLEAWQPDGTGPPTSDPSP